MKERTSPTLLLPLVNFVESRERGGDGELDLLSFMKSRPEIGEDHNSSPFARLRRYQLCTLPYLTLVYPSTKF